MVWPDRLTMALAVWLALPGMASAEGEFELSTREEGKTVVFVGENAHPCMPYHAVIKFKKLINYRASVKLPARVVVPPGETVDLFSLTVIKLGRRTGYSVSMKSSPGDPNAVPDRSYLYVLPFEHGTKHLVGQGYLGKFTHKKSYSLDFNMEEGTPVCAARDGVVFKLKDDSNEGGRGRKFDRKANFIGVLHEDGTWADYAHLKQHGVDVKIGNRVEAGQVIGFSGNTGRTNGPHLHFAVRRATWASSTTMPTAFLSEGGEPVTIEESRWYYAYHLDSEPFEAVLGERLVEAELERHWQTVPLNGKVDFRTEQIDNKIVLYCRNGTREFQKVKVKFQRLVNLMSSKPMPLTVAVPSGIEVYVLTLTQKPGSGRSSYQLEYSSKAVKKRSPRQR